MPEPRPDPDELLARVARDEARARRGKLTVFFGAAPGVGKTYTMLEAARRELSDLGRDVVVGVVETHGRYETGALLIGLEIVPRRVVEHRRIQLTELDVDAVLARKPALVLVDELAHENAPGSRHKKRWQDVEDVLDAGIDVFTTLNVQHLESLVDVVAQVTGVVVRETVPDAVLERAHDVRLVDLPVPELLERLREGKVYVPAQVSRAIDGFFREGNLIALRELALRRTADRVDAQMRGYREAHGIDATWPTGERVLVCISASPHSARLVRGARRLASRLHAELVGVYVETPASLRMNAADRARLADNTRLLESLGGEMVTLRGDDAAAETVRLARKRNVTKVVVGKPTHPRWRDVMRTPFVDDVIRQSREIDVYVISGEEGRTEDGHAPASHRSAPGLAGYVASVTAVVLATALSWIAFGHEQLADVVIVYLLGVVLVSLRFARAPSLVAALLSVIAYDFFFIPPYYSFAVSDLRHLLTFGVMLVVATVISSLTHRVRVQADSARDRERRTAALYAASRELGRATSTAELVVASRRQLEELLGLHAFVFVPDESGNLTARAVAAASDVPAGAQGVVEWVWSKQRHAGAGTDTLPASEVYAVPLVGAAGGVGVLALATATRSSPLSSDERELLDAFARLLGSAIERVELAEAARRASLRAETEQLRNALLSSVSHDLRTPLAVITGATTTLLDAGGPKDAAVQRELLETARDEARRLARLVANLLDMTRVEAGALRVHKEEQPIEEVIGAALNRLEDRLAGREVVTDVPADLPLVPLDPVLVEQVLINLLENALKYTPAGSPLHVAARAEASEVVVEVADRGPGVAAEDQERVFEKFYRVKHGEGGGSVGLGLSICRGIVRAHRGRIWVEPRRGGGARFRFALPLAEPAKASATALRRAESEVSR